MKLRTNIRIRKKRLNKKLKLGTFQELYFHFEADAVNPPTHDTDSLTDFYICITDSICDVVETFKGHCTTSCSKESISGGFIVNVDTDCNRLITELKEISELSNLLVYKGLDANYSPIWDHNDTFEHIKSKGLHM